MVTIESNAERRDGVTLVTATIEVEDGPTRITVESRLDGPVWPPRRQGEPAAGWECGRDGAESAPSFEGVVPEEGRLAIGFASPAEPVDAPLAVSCVAPARSEGTTGEADEMATPAGVLRGLGDPSPPSLIETDASPPEPPIGDEGDEVVTAEIAAEATDPAASDRAAPDPNVRQEDEAPATEGDSPLPPDLVAWLDATEARIECAEALEATASVEAATAALCECGGVDGARSLDARLTTDADRLRTVAKRVTALADRAESATVATEALERLP